MAEGGQPVEKLRHFLRELSPQARALLIAELERGIVRGDDIPGGDLVLQEVRNAVRESAQATPRVGNPARLFFRPLEPFLIPNAGPHPQPARIARQCLDPLWDWIGRDLLPAETKAFIDDLSQSLGANDAARANQLTRAFQDRVIESIAQLLTKVASDKERRRLGAQLGTPRGVEDLTEILVILKARELIAQLAERLPGHVRNLADDVLENAKALLDAVVPKHGDLRLLGLVFLMGRLAAPWQIIRLAVLSAESDDMARIATTPYAEAVPIVLGEIERMVGELKNELKSAGAIAVVSLLKWIHDAVRGLRTEVDLPVDHPLGRRLAAIRSDIANILKTEIESMPGRVRRLLRPRPASEIAPGSVLDPTDVADIEAVIEVVAACRSFAGELAVSEMTLRTWSELEHYLDTNTNGLVDSLRTARDGDRPFRQSQVDAAIRFCATVFGRDYSQVLKKAAEVAVNSERKTAQV